jgi:predicted Zn-dependent protease
MLGYFYAAWDLDKAVSEYSSLYSDHPKDIQVKKNYIQLLILKNRVEEATKLNDEVLKTSPHDVEALVYRGQILLHKNNASGAVDALQSALRNDPDNGSAHFWLGNAFAQQRDEARAESEWREAVRLRPDLTEAQRSLGAMELRRGDIDAVLQTTQQNINTPAGLRKILHPRFNWATFNSHRSISPRLRSSTGKRLIRTLLPPMASAAS